MGGFIERTDQRSGLDEAEAAVLATVDDVERVGRVIREDEELAILHQIELDGGLLDGERLGSIVTLTRDGDRAVRRGEGADLGGVLGGLAAIALTRFIVATNLWAEVTRALGFSSRVSRASGSQRLVTHASGVHETR